MTDKILDEGHVGTRIVWVRLKGSICNIVFIVCYSYIRTAQREIAEASCERHNRAARKIVKNS